VTEKLLCGIAKSFGSASTATEEASCQEWGFLQTSRVFAVALVIFSGFATLAAFGMGDKTMNFATMKSVTGFANFLAGASALPPNPSSLLPSASPSACFVLLVSFCPASCHP
jgi:hypothetical protein